MSEPLIEQRQAWQSMLKHDLNNALTSIKTGLDIMAMDDAFDGTELGDDLQDIVLGAKRMGQMIEDLRLVFADQSSGPNHGSRSTPQAVIEELQQHLAHTAIQLKTDVQQDAALQMDSGLLVRTLHYVCLAKDEVKRELQLLSFRKGKEKGHGWIFPLGPDAKGLFQQTLQKGQADQRCQTYLQLAHQGTLALKGRMSIKEKGSDGFLVLNFPES